MGKVSYSKLLVVDLEGTCWEDIPRAEQSKITEIIEIGITQVDLIEKRIEKTKHYLVKPKKTEITPYCTLLTGITPEMINSEGMELTRVSKLIRNEFPVTSSYWGSWGDDIILLKKDCELKNAVMPFNNDRFLNFQDMYSLKNGLERSVALIKVMESLELDFQGKQHRAGPDSFNTAKVILKGIFE